MGGFAPGRCADAPRTPTAGRDNPLPLVLLMAIGFVLIQTAPGRENDVLNALRTVPEVRELHSLFGEFDLIAKVEARDFDALGHAITTRLRVVPGITSTRTLTETRFGNGVG